MHAVLVHPCHTLCIHAHYSTVPHPTPIYPLHTPHLDIARDPFEYISQNLLGRDVMYACADVYLGGGFDRVDPVAMDKQKIMYALSRKVTDEDANRPECAHINKNSTSLEDKCRNRSGSHDVFFFRLHEPMKEEDLAKHLDFDIARFGQESRVIWFFENVLNFCVLNPCKILELYHYHCSDMRTNIYKPKLSTLVLLSQLTNYFVK